MFYRALNAFRLINKTGSQCTGVQIAESNISLNVGASKKLTCTVSPSGASTTLIWDTSDTHVATVDSSGNVKAIANGDATISVTTKEGFVDICIVQVRIQTTDITIDDTNLTIPDVGMSYMVNAQVVPPTSTQPITYRSENTAIATVDSHGLIQSIKVGSTRIVVQSGTIKKYINVNVGIDVTAIAFDKTSHSFTKENESYSIKATISPTDATDKTLKWTTSNANIATVDNGVVVAKASGNATITATSAFTPSIKKTFTANVSIPPTGIDIKQANITIDGLNKTSTLQATVFPAGANNKTVTWTSSDTTIATVSSTGVVTSKKAGIAIITARNSAGHTDTATVEIIISPTNLELTPSSLSFTTFAKSQAIIPIFTPSNSTQTSLTWTSSNTAIATVDNKGIVTSKANGSCTITAKTTNNISKTCSVTVRVPVESVTLDKNRHEIFNSPTGGFKLNATILPSNSAVRVVTWTSSNTNIATVDTNGNVKFKRFGSCIISAEADGKRADCTVISTEIMLEKITLNPSSFILDELGQTHQINYTLHPSNTYNKNVTFVKVDADAGFTVSSTGLVTCTGLKDGNILVKGSNNKEATFTVDVDSIEILYDIYAQKTANLRVSMQEANEKIAEVKIQLESDKIQSQIDALEGKYDKEIGELDSAVSNIKDNILAGLEDGVLTEIEKAKIETSLQSLNKEHIEAEEVYEETFSNKDLVDTATSSAKMNLQISFARYDEAFYMLVEQIQAILEADVITEIALGALEGRFKTHDKAYATFKVAMQKAIDAIAKRKADIATGESKQYTDAKIEVTDQKIESTVYKVNQLDGDMNYAYSQIQQMSDKIVSKVDANGVSSIIQQNPSSIQIGFNKISRVVEINSTGIELYLTNGEKHTRLYNGQIQFTKKGQPVILGSFARTQWSGTNIQGLSCKLEQQTSFSVVFNNGSNYLSPFIISEATFTSGNGVTIHKGTNNLSDLHMHNFDINNVDRMTVRDITNGRFRCAANYVKAPIVIGEQQVQSPSFATIKSYHSQTRNGLSEDSVKNELVGTFTPNTEIIGSAKIVDGKAVIAIPRALKGLSVGRYTVQLTPIGNKQIHVIEKGMNALVIGGDDCEFDYIIKALIAPTKQSRIDSALIKEDEPKSTMKQFGLQVEYEEGL